jgi:8-oxo-dGTP pyrophosphatase MutT (NUDIX family)
VVTSPALRAAIGLQLARFGRPEQGPVAAPALQAAAVAVALTEEGHGAALPGLPVHRHWSEEAALILTRRASGLRRHAGQWALPGGRIDPGESAEQAALRELQEEVHLQLDASDVLGRLDDFVTRSGFVITPVVVWAGAARGIAPNPGEVQSIHRIPVSEFMREDAPWLEASSDGEHPILRMPVGEGWIAAPTAAILYQFREVCIAGRHTRVAHFEQPLFARK